MPPRPPISPIWFPISGFMLLSLAGCAAPGERMAAGCAAEHAELDRVAKAFAAEAPAFEAAAFATAQSSAGRASADPASDARRLNDQAARLDRSVGGIADALTVVERCRGSRIAGGPAAPAVAKAERAAFGAELADARQSLAAAETVRATLDGAADRLVAASPGARLTAARAAAAPPPPPQPFIAVENATIHAKPDPESAAIAPLRKGTRAQATETVATKPGWTTLVLNDGSFGYVETATLRPATLNASAAAEAAKARALHSAESDPVVALSVLARQAMPAAVAALGARIEAGAADPAFQPPVAGR